MKLPITLLILSFGSTAIHVSGATTRGSGVGKEEEEQEPTQSLVQKPNGGQSGIFGGPHQPETSSKDEIGNGAKADALVVATPPTWMDGKGGQLPSPSMPVGTKRDVTVVISSSKTAFPTDESVLIQVTLKNNKPQKRAKILDWVNPCTEVDFTPADMSFFDIRTTGGRAATYVGALIKRIKPTKNDYTILKPGDQVTCTIDLGKYYDFAAASDDNVYEIKYGTTSMQLSSSTSEGPEAVEHLDSKALTVKIDAREDPSRHHSHRNLNIRRLQGTPITRFNGCNASQQNDAIEARTKALAASTEVVNHLMRIGQEGSSAQCPRHDEWFNSYNLNRHNELKTGFGAVRAKLNDADILFDCSCNRNGVFAYVVSNQPYNIWLCPAFWTAGMTGTDSKMGTVVHEMSHFDITANTDDHAYGQAACRSLADNQRDLAVNNADSHEYMAENTPSLACTSAHNFKLDLKTDRWPLETSWQLLKHNTGQIVQSRGEGYYTGKSTSYTESYSVPLQTYDFTIHDSYGDGLCCGYGEGSYSIYWGGERVATGGDFGYFRTTTTFGPPTPSPTPRPTPGPSCMSGDTRVGMPSTTQFKSVRDLNIGDTIEGLDENMDLTTCSVEAVGHFGTGPVFGNYTKDHFILHTSKGVVHPNGDNGNFVIVDKYAVLTSCPVGLDESGIGFTAVDSDFVGDEPLAWSDYVLIHQAIVNIVREVGPFVFSPSTYTSMGKVKHYTKRLYKTMLRCAKDPDTCDKFEKAAVDIVENALTANAKKKVKAGFGNLGKSKMSGSVAAAMSKGKSVRD